MHAIKSSQKKTSSHLSQIIFVEKFGLKSVKSLSFCVRTERQEEEEEEEESSSSGSRVVVNIRDR
jgi:hypothetical protein